MARSDHCCICGERRRPTQKPVPSFGNDIEIVTMKNYREMKPGRWEDSPQLLVSVGLWRNGGTAPGETHICDGCIVIGLKRAKEFCEKALLGLDGL